MHKQLTRGNWVSLLISAVFLCLVGAPAAAQDTLEKIKRSGELLAGVRPDGPPLGFRDEKGEFAGFGVDVAKAVAQKLGVKVTFVPSNSSTRIPLLTSGRIDAEFGSTTPTRDREDVADFTIVYIWDEVLMLVRAGQSHKPVDYKPPKKVSTTQGNFAISLFKKIVPEADIVIFPEYTEAVLALVAGKVDAVLTTRYIAESWKKKYSTQIEIGDTFFTDPEAIMVRENDSKWRKFLNWTLQEMWADGRFQALYEKHFSYKPNYSLWSERGLQPGIVK
jgi:polar amino acid transport system substrate-binding protein